MIHVFYNENYNIDLGLLNYLHPFDGLKFKKIHNEIKNNKSITFHSPSSPISIEVIKEYFNELNVLLMEEKVPVLRALEVPYIPFVSFKYIDKNILLPMRHAVKSTKLATKLAISGEYCWNLSGGFHHASQHSMEGFCIYNDIGISYQELLKSNELNSEDKVLIIDTDAHHGNGNARTFMDNSNITILDVFNESIYPQTKSTRDRVNIPVPMQEKVTGSVYLEKYKAALGRLSGIYKVAFVIAGTDVISTDKLGGMSLSIDDVVEREVATFKRLKELNIPAVFLGGGGYSKESYLTTSRAINSIAQLENKKA